MPPKRDPSNNETPTTSSANNSNATLAALQANTTTSSTTNNGSNNTTATAAAAAAASLNALPILVADAAAEQRTIAYQANAKLCRLVRKCPWMYDRNHHNYAKKHILDKSWCKIARECNDSVASCKERWRNIRAAFARSINIYKTHSGPNRVKPYYLHKELSFLVKPMMEGRDKKDEYDDTPEGSGGGGGGVKDEETAEEGEAEDDDEEEEEPAEEEEDFHDDTADIKSAFEALNPDIRIQAETRYQKLLRNNNNNHNNNDFESSGIFEPHTEFTTASDAENEYHFNDEILSQSEAERRVAHMLQQNGLKRPPMHLETETYDTKRFKLSQTSNTASENDIRFLEALLPDMALMNTRQKIIFKRKIYQTLEEVFENSHDFPNIEHNKMEHTTTATNSSPPNQHSYHSSPLSSQTQVRQTVLTVNSSTARSLINNIANLNETELQKVNGFLQNSLRNLGPHQRLANGNNAPSSAAAKLMSSTPKITITKVTCPPPAALRNLGLAKPPSPSPATVSTTIHNPASAVISSNVHSTTSSNPGKACITQNGSNAASSSHQNNSPWTQLLPITIKDEIEDVDIV
ncbi:probable WRKY transcription factor protein 1 [Calliphora vicina]|uniref:probable WRKY transcription factor protein 1 n=1 Tax=Calliphora vicina TaxID=7373 RepID=UPI00325A929D